jgi:RecB family exonuclease
MRLDAGLLLPERQIGLSAHDFQQAIGAPEVILSRALRDAEAQTVPSRWVNRLVNLISGLPAQSGVVALTEMRARGRLWLDEARAVEGDLSGVPETCARRNPRPAPAPPRNARLHELPVTRIETLVRDPFAIYAERLLKLRALRPLAPEADARQRGTVLHRIPEEYVRQHPPGTPGSLSTFLAIAETVLAEECAWPAIRAHWLARLDRVAASFVAWNAALEGELVLREKRGALTLGSPPFTLTGQPDRIDRDPQGNLRLYDYKTGTLPSKNQIRYFNKQLILLSIMATEDAFGLGPAEVADARFIGLGSAFNEREVDINPQDLGKHRDEFLRLIAQYRRADQGFTAHRAVDFERRVGDYDPLSRRGEWAPGDPVVTIPVGDHDG